MELNGKTLGRISGIAIPAVMVAAVAVGVTAIRGDPEPSDVVRPAVSTVSPVLMADGDIEYQEEEIPGGDNDVTSIGVSEGGLVVTEGGAPGEGVVRVYGEDAGVIEEYYGVNGIALADPAGHFAAWIESGAEGSSDPEAVVVNTESGEVLQRAAVPPRTSVMAVAGGFVAMSDGDVSRLWSINDGSMSSLNFAPDDYYVVGLTEDRVLLSDLDSVTQLYGLDGVLIEEYSGLVSWDVDTESGLLAGATRSGDVALIDTADGSRTPVEPGVDAVTASFGSDDSILVNTAGSIDPSNERYTVVVCEPNAECDPVISDGIPYLPNEALSQLVSQSK